MLRSVDQLIRDTDKSTGKPVDSPVALQTCRFDVRVMTEGRMKGQAFVGLPSETLATRALEETNGYKLHDRPICVVSFHIRTFSY